MSYRNYSLDGNFTRAEALLYCVGFLFMLATQVAAQNPAGALTRQAKPSNSVSAEPMSRGAAARFEPPVTPRRAQLYYESLWGIGGLTVKVSESGELVRFSYQVVDPERAKVLNDKTIEPSLISPSGHITLSVPSLEKVGQLRQSNTPEAGKSYWMAFSNPGRVVKRGDRVDISVGTFRAEGLVVQ